MNIRGHSWSVKYKLEVLIDQSSASLRSLLVSQVQAGGHSWSVKCKLEVILGQSSASLKILGHSWSFVIIHVVKYMVMHMDGQLTEARRSSVFGGFDTDLSSVPPNRSVSKPGF